MWTPIKFNTMWTPIKYCPFTLISTWNHPHGWMQSYVNKVRAESRANKAISWNILLFRSRGSKQISRVQLKHASLLNSAATRLSRSFYARSSQTPVPPQKLRDLFNGRLPLLKWWWAITSLPGRLTSFPLTSPFESAREKNLMALSHTSSPRAVSLFISGVLAEKKK